MAGRWGVADHDQPILRNLAPLPGDLCVRFVGHDDQVRSAIGGFLELLGEPSKQRPDAPVSPFGEAQFRIGVVLVVDVAGAEGPPAETSKQNRSGGLQPCSASMRRRLRSHSSQAAVNSIDGAYSMR